MSHDAKIPPKIDLVRPTWSVTTLAKIARKNVLELIPEQTLTHPIISGTKGTRWHMIMDPEALQRVLQENEPNYPKAEVAKSIARPAIGESVFVADGAEWRWQRRVVAPVFSHRNVTGLSPKMEAAADRACERLDKHVGGSANLLDEMVRTTFEVISDTTLSGDGQYDSAQVQAAFDAYISRTASASLLDVFGLPAWVPRPRRVFGARHIRYMTKMADGIIVQREKSGPQQPPDLLDLLMRGEDPKSGRKMTTADIRNNLLTFIFAGHETTALTLAWAMYLCAFDEDVQSRIRKEAQTAIGSRTATQADLPKLQFTKQVIEETLRLYPPFAMIARTAQAADELMGVEIQAGDTVVIPIYSLHRSRRLWKDPDAFRPDRFAPRNKHPRYKFIPFGDGPRVCIGMSFALQEAVIILATLLARYRFTLVPGKVPVPRLILTLRPEGGVHLNIERA